MRVNSLTWPTVWRDPATRRDDCGNVPLDTSVAAGYTLPLRCSLTTRDVFAVGRSACAQIVRDPGRTPLGRLAHSPQHRRPSRRDLRTDSQRPRPGFLRQDSRAT